MNLIESHMEQISLSSVAITELPFPPPKAFTNALLHPHDITALIRDTEAHERALFKPAQPEPGSVETYTRRTTHYASGLDVTSNNSGYPGLKPSSAVGRILGGDMLERIKRSEKMAEGKGAKDVDIEVLLSGAERLSGIYPVPGALERIKALRQRHEELLNSVEYYESKVAEQTVLLDRVHHPKANDVSTQSEEPGDSFRDAHQRDSYTAEDFQKEESEMRDLEEKRRALEDRVSGMARDLGGLRR